MICSERDTPYPIVHTTYLFGHQYGVPPVKVARGQSPDQAVISEMASKVHVVISLPRVWTQPLDGQATHRPRRMEEALEEGWARDHDRIVSTPVAVGYIMSRKVSTLGPSLQGLERTSCRLE
jgi:hypothetical protein